MALLQTVSSKPHSGLRPVLRPHNSRTLEFISSESHQEPLTDSHHLISQKVSLIRSAHFVENSLGATKNFAFLILPGFSSIHLTSAIHVLSLVNQTTGREAYTWQILSEDGGQVSTIDGLEIGVQHSIETVKLQGLDRLVVCGDTQYKTPDRRLKQWLHKVDRFNIELGAINTGTYLLATAGLLDGYRCTTHWKHVEKLIEDFSHLQISSQLFEIDRDRFTCSGGSSVLDLMMHIVCRDHGKPLAASISELLICDRVREPEEPQRIPLRSLLGPTQPLLAEAVALMEANIEEPIPLADLAQYLKISRRHLERLFRKHLNCQPTRYYLGLRLKRARQLVLQTNMSVTETGLASGFCSSSHYCKCYRDFFGISPREHRGQFRASTNKHVAYI